MLESGVSALTRTLMMGKGRDSGLAGMSRYLRFRLECMGCFTSYNTPFLCVAHEK